MSAMIQRTSESSEESSDLISNTEKSSDEGLALLHSLKKSLNGITDSNQVIEDAISNKFNEIEKSLEMIERISENTKLIHDIVFKTKLLSFNASVEAARAGEHGKGFSVVAEEIGNLAKVSGDSATKIESIIETAKTELSSIIASSIEETQSLFCHNKEKLEDGDKSVSECSMKFNEVQNSIQLVSQAFKEINVSNIEQAAGVKEVSSSAHDFELASKICLSIASENQSSANQLRKEVSILEQQIGKIKVTIFGEKNDKVKTRKFSKVLSFARPSKKQSSSTKKNKLSA